ncbi:unnamed protein product [Rotaria socialis]
MIIVQSTSHSANDYTHSAKYHSDRTKYRSHSTNGNSHSTNDYTHSTKYGSHCPNDHSHGTKYHGDSTKYHSHGTNDYSHRPMCNCRGVHDDSYRSLKHEGGHFDTVTVIHWTTNRAACVMATVLCLMSMGFVVHVL